MIINPADFAPAQLTALFDLLVLAMYADGHLTIIEEEKLGAVLRLMGFENEADRHREFDAAVTRITPHLRSLAQAKDHACALAQNFSTRPQQQQAYAAVQEIMGTDHNLSGWETTLIAELRLRLKM